MKRAHFTIPANDDGAPMPLPLPWLILLGLASWAWLLGLVSLARLAWNVLR